MNMSNCKFHSLRLTPTQELKTSLEKYVQENVANGCFVVSCCGSITQVTLRYAANSQAITNKIETLKEHFEVLSLVGTISASGTHLHISLGDNNGRMRGGHLMGNAPVFTTMEVMLAEPLDVTLTREDDKQTGFDELVVKKIQ